MYLSLRTGYYRSSILSNWQRLSMQRLSILSNWQKNNIGAIYSKLILF
jgi:hypothetical protein